MPKLDVADILATEITGGEVRANLGFSDTGKGIGASEPMWFGADGFISRPADPDDDGACMALYYAEGNDKRLISYRDNRFADKVGALEPGDRAIIGPSEARVFVKAADGSVSLYTASKPDGGQTMLVNLNAETGEVTISCAGSWIKMKNDSIVMGVAGGKAMLTLDEKGLQVDGDSFRCATKSGHLGVLGPQAPPLAPIASIIIGPSGILGVPSASWTCSPV